MLISSSNNHIEWNIFTKQISTDFMSVITDILNMAYVSWILSHKLLCCFIVTSASFAIATIVLGVENTNLRDKINELENQNHSSNSNTMSKYRLPETVKPQLYDLYLYPNLTTGLFKGNWYKHLHYTNNNNVNSSYNSFRI